MHRETRSVSESVLGDLIAAGAILSVFILEDDEGHFHILARSVKQVDHRLMKKRGGYRQFKTIDAAAKLVRQLGISRIQLHMNAFAPGTEPLPPDRMSGKLAGFT